VRDRALAVLGLDAQRAVDPAMPLAEWGLDSLLAVELRNVFASAFGRPLPATLLFDHPTIDALTDHLISEVLGPSSTPPAAEAPAQAVGKARGGAAMVDSIQDLTDEEVERQLAARTPSRTRP
jgi:acyl carrier protein